jgi:hypothetical protein
MEQKVKYNMQLKIWQHYKVISKCISALCIGPVAILNSKLELGSDKADCLPINNSSINFIDFRI